MSGFSNKNIINSSKKAARGGKANCASGKNTLKNSDKSTAKISGNAGEKAQKSSGKASLTSRSKSVCKAGEKRSDMAVELVGRSADNLKSGAIVKSRVDVDKVLARKIGKPEGVYLTLETDIVATGLRPCFDTLSDELAAAIRKLSPHVESVLVVCLGNPNLTADALGSRVFDRLTVTRHLPEDIPVKTSISALCPNVFGATGIESFDIIKGVAQRTKPQLVVAVDSLASAAVGRIASAFQLCSSGITPGSGVANHRIRLSRSTLGVEVISIGVPLVVYASTIIAEGVGANAAYELSDELRNFIVTPKDIDVLVEECAGIIADAINKAFL